MVAWPAVCRPKDLGGLGIPNIRLTNIRCKHDGFGSNTPTSSEHGQLCRSR
jgi:hypothetical protein